MKWLLVLLALLFPAGVKAQSTADQVIPGFLSAAGQNGCPATNACFVPYSATNPLPVNATVSASVAVAPLTSTNLSGTVAVTNTFQSIQVSTAGRNGCTVQNNDTNSMWVFFGAIGSATKAHSIVLAAGQALSCAVGGLGVLTDQISITGTSTGVFFAAVQ